jgi:hypothetical protein
MVPAKGKTHHNHAPPAGSVPAKGANARLSAFAGLGGSRARR